MSTTLLFILNLIAAVTAVVSIRKNILTRRRVVRYEDYHNTKPAFVTLIDDLFHFAVIGICIKQTITFMSLSMCFWQLLAGCWLVEFLFMVKDKTYRGYEFWKQKYVPANKYRKYWGKLEYQVIDEMDSRGFMETMTLSQRSTLATTILRLFCKTLKDLDNLEKLQEIYDQKVAEFFENASKSHKTS